MYKNIKHKNLSILFTILALLVLISFITYFAGNIIYTEVQRLIRFLSDYENIAVRISQAISDVEEIEFLAEIDIEGRLVQIARDVGNRVTGFDFIGIFDSLAQMFIIVFLTPFLVIYFLKDDRLLFKKFLKLVPKEKRDTVKAIIGKIDRTFGVYIPSQLFSWSYLRYYYVHRLYDYRDAQCPGSGFYPGSSIYHTIYRTGNWRCPGCFYCLNDQLGNVNPGSCFNDDCPAV